MQPPEVVPKNLFFKILHNSLKDIYNRVLFSKLACNLVKKDFMTYGSYFLVNFVKLLRTVFCRTPPCNCVIPNVCSTYRNIREGFSVFSHSKFNPFMHNVLKWPKIL